MKNKDEKQKEITYLRELINQLLNEKKIMKQTIEQIQNDLTAITDILKDVSNIFDSLNQEIKKIKNSHPVQNNPEQKRPVNIRYGKNKWESWQNDDQNVQVQFIGIDGNYSQEPDKFGTYTYTAYESYDNKKETENKKKVVKSLTQILEKIKTKKEEKNNSNIIIEKENNCCCCEDMSICNCQEEFENTVEDNILKNKIKTQDEVYHYTRFLNTIPEDASVFQMANLILDILGEKYTACQGGKIHYFYTNDNNIEIDRDPDVNIKIAYLPDNSNEYTEVYISDKSGQPTLYNRGDWEKIIKNICLSLNEKELTNSTLINRYYDIKRSLKQAAFAKCFCDTSDVQKWELKIELLNNQLEEIKKLLDN